MIIDITCGKVINSKDVYIHDDIVEMICFSRKEKKLHLSILKQGIDEQKATIDFLQVIGFEMTACDFWGRSPHVFDFEYIPTSEQILIPKLFEKKGDNNFPYCSLKDRDKYLETLITFTSGDQLRVACEEIVL